MPLIAVMRHQGDRAAVTTTAAVPARTPRTREWYRALRGQTVGRTAWLSPSSPTRSARSTASGRSWRQNRLDLLRYGVDVLSALPDATIYLEGGASDWEPAAPHRGAAALHRRRQGARLHAQRDPLRLDGRTTSATGSKSRAASGASRSSSTPRSTAAAPCTGATPPARRHERLVPSAAARPRHPRRPRPPIIRKVDAYLWIGRPGYSGGSCNGGPLPVGAWWPSAGLMLGRYATNWISPPRGTRLRAVSPHIRVRELAGRRVSLTRESTLA